MSSGVSQFKRITLSEGQIQWIAERDTPEERLAAWDAITCLILGEPAYGMAISYEGNKACARVKRDAYLLFKDSVKTIDEDVQVPMVRTKNPRRVAAGIAGAGRRYGKQYGSSIDSSCGEGSTCRVEEENVQNRDMPMSVSQETLPSPIANDDFSEYRAGNRKAYGRLTEAEKRKVAELAEKFPDATSLQSYLENNYFYQNKKLVVSTDFCNYAWAKLAREDGWLNPRTKKPIKGISDAIHWLAIRFMERANDIQRAETVQKQKNLLTEFELKATQYDLEEESELASKERRRRLAAEKQMAERLCKK